MERNYAPIAMFVYKRLAHTKKTIEALQRNELSIYSSLIIYSDGYKNETDKEGVENLRAYIKNVSGFKDIKIIEREKNIGLASNIINGVTETVKKYGKIIVIEDDIVTGKYFLKYMNDALDKYENSEKVMEISGMSYPMDKEGLPETMFLHFADCWGWATWKRAWDKFEKNPKKVMRSFSRNDRYHFDMENRIKSWEQVVYNRWGIMDTWAVFWEVTLYKEKGLMLFPRDSLVQNIGFDNSGEHFAKSNPLDIPASDKPVTYFPPLDEIKEDADVHNRFADCQYELSKQFQNGILKKIIKRLSRIMTNKRVKT